MFVAVTTPENPARQLQPLTRCIPAALGTISQAIGVQTPAQIREVVLNETGPPMAPGRQAQEGPPEKAGQNICDVCE